MAEAQVFVNLNFNKQSLISVKVYPLPTTSRTALSLVAGDEGLAVWDTTLKALMFWNGTAWVSAVSVASGLIPRGGIAANAIAPVSPANGDLYVFNSAGTTGASWVPIATVEVGDQVWWDANTSNWQYLQSNIGQASTSVAGLVVLSTQGEVNTGSEPNKSVTPATLSGYVPANALILRPSRRAKTLIASLAANTPSTVTHGLGLAVSTDLVVDAWQGGVKIVLAIALVDANSITVTSNVALSNVTVVCEG